MVDTLAPVNELPWGTFKVDNINQIFAAIAGDEYDSDAAAEQNGGAQVGGFPEDGKRIILDTLEAHLLDKTDAEVLESGIGQWAFPIPYVTHAVDASDFMVRSLKSKLDAGSYNINPPGVRLTSNNVYFAVSESLAPEWDEKFEAVLFLNGFFQVRSDYEALIEANRVLKTGGLFIFNLYSDDSEDIICGRSLNPENYIRVVEEFGFKLQAWNKHVGHSKGIKGNNFLTFRKVSPFRVEKLRKLQLVRGADGRYTANNLDVEGRDRVYL